MHIGSSVPARWPRPSPARRSTPDITSFSAIAGGRTAWRHWLPGARVVKALNASFMANFAKPPIVGGMRRVAFVSGDDRAAKTTVADLLESFGFAPVDLGSLRDGGRIQGVGAPIAGHDFFLPWPAPRSFPAFNGEQGAR